MSALRSSMHPEMIRFSALETVRGMIVNSDTKSEVDDTRLPESALVVILSVRQKQDLEWSFSAFVLDDSHQESHAGPHVRLLTAELLRQRLDGYTVDNSVSIPDGVDVRLLAVAQVDGSRTHSTKMHALNRSGVQRAMTGRGVMATMFFADQEFSTIHVDEAGSATAISSAKLPIDYVSASSTDIKDVDLSGLVVDADAVAHPTEFELARYFVVLTASTEDLDML